MGRHDNVRDFFAKACSTLASTFVDVKPRTLEGPTPKGFRVRDRGMNGSRSLDCDVMVYTLCHGGAHKTTTRVPVDTTKMEYFLAQICLYLAVIGKRGTNRAPTTTGEFRPLVLSSGGLIPKEYRTNWRLGNRNFTRLFMTV